MRFTRLLLFTSLYVSSCENWRKMKVYHTQVFPMSFTALEGNIVKAYCGSMSPVKWTYGPNHLPLPSHTVFNNSIILNNVRLSDTGKYFCNGTYQNEVQEIKTFVNYFIIKVFETAEEGLILPNFLEVSEGSNATLTCGSLKQAEWFSKNIQSQKKTIIGNTLILHHLRKEQSGLYVCRGVEKHNLDEHMRVFHNDATIIVDGYVDIIMSNTLYPTLAEIIEALNEMFD